MCAVPVPDPSAAPSRVNFADLVKERRIILWGKAVREAELAVLAKVLRTSKVLQELWLKVDGDTLLDNSFASALAGNCTLKFLGVGGHRAGHVGGAKRLAGALILNQTLQKIVLLGNNADVDCNTLGDEVAKQLAKALKVNQFLLGAYVYNHRIGDEGASKLAGALAVNKSLREVSLRGNAISDAGAKKLAKALKHNHVIEKLNVEDNHISCKLREKIEAILADPTREIRTCAKVPDTSHTNQETSLVDRVVRLHGLKHDSMNGRIGLVLSTAASTGRVQVQLLADELGEDIRTVSLKPENLEAFAVEEANGDTAVPPRASSEPWATPANSSDNDNANARRRVCSESLPHDPLRDPADAPGESPPPPRASRRISTDDLAVVEQRTLRRRNVAGEAPYHRRARAHGSNPAVDSRRRDPGDAPGEKYWPRRTPRRTSTDDLAIVEQRTLRRRNGAREGPCHRRTRDAPPRKPADAPGETPASRRMPRRTSVDDLAVVEQQTLHRRNGAREGPCHRRTRDTRGSDPAADAPLRKPADALGEKPASRRMPQRNSTDDLAVVEQRTLRRRNRAEQAPCHWRARDAHGRDPAVAPMCDRALADNVTVAEQRTLRHRQGAGSGSNRRLTTNVHGRTPAAVPRTDPAVADDIDVVEQRIRRRRGARGAAPCVPSPPDTAHVARARRPLRSTVDDLGVLEQRTRQRRGGAPASGAKSLPHNTPRCTPIDDLDAVENRTLQCRAARGADPGAAARPITPPRRPAVLSGRPGPFLAAYDWREVLPGQSIPAGLEITMSLEEGVPSIARIPPDWRLDVYLTATVVVATTERVRVDVQRATTIAEVIQRVGEAQAGARGRHPILSIDGEPWSDEMATVERAGLFAKRITLAYRG